MNLNRIAFLVFFAVGLPAADAPKATPPASPSIADPRSVTVGERSVVPINVCQLQNTILVLPQDEATRSTYVADTENWVLQTTKDNASSRFLSIKLKTPLTQATTLNVITSHDISYTFKLVMTTDHCDSKVFVDADSQLATEIKNTRPWLSPDEADRLKAEVAASTKASADEKIAAQGKIDAFQSAYPSKLVFDYRFEEKSAERMGIHAIFHDSRFTYVKGNPQETPALYELKQGKPSLINFDFKDGLYSTNRIIDEGYLAVGGNGNGKHQEKLEFKRVAEVTN